jgi:amino acid adenylation domain-containing protein
MLREDASFELNLREVKKNILDAYDHHQATLGGILQHLRVPRASGRPPLVEVIFNVDRDPGSESFYELEFTCERNPKRALHFDLFFNFVEGLQGLCLECDYNTDLFDAATIERWLGHYETLLDSVVNNPTETLGKLPILTGSESHDLVHQWSEADRQFPKQRTLQEWFETQVETNPDVRAVTFQDGHVTYRELNSRANQIAHHLIRLGVGADMLVGLYVERSLDLPAAILGILKAGGAYLPIDAAYPPERIAFMLEDANISVVLTQSALVSSLPARKINSICLDRERALFQENSTANPAIRSNPDSIAYVIYTSGSTGKPKGTLVTHYNVVRLMQATEGWYRFDKRDVWTLFHSHAFDFSVWELWGALLYGGRLVVVPYVTSRSPSEFYQLLIDERVTVLNQTPSAFKQLIEADATRDSSSNLVLRYVIFGGEALEMQSLKPWFARHGDQYPVLVNMYGITETTVHVTYRPLSKADVTAGSVIGIPIPDLQVYILDSLQQPVPIGVAGEICVGGAGVAQGYLGRDALTRERFLPDTFGGKPGNQLYRSGDLGRRLPNQEIEYLGRIDDQVKIRGFRIEPSEIEVSLKHHPAVGQCTVAVFAEGGDKLLAAYFTLRSGSVAPSASELRAHLKTTLPDYMVPSAFVLLDKIPLTSNGKIDRKALPPPDGNQIEIGGGFVPARDSLEQALAQLWAKILKVKRVGIYNNFFELGGHSLLAVRLVAEIEKFYNRRLPLATLFRAPTVADLAEILRSNDWVPSWSSLVPIRPGGSKPPFFLMHSHGGNVLEYYPLVERLDPDQPVYALQARGLDARIIKNATIEDMAAAYLSEIRSLQPQGPYFLGGFCFGGLVALEAAQQLTAVGEEVSLLAIIQTVHPAGARFKPGTTWFQRCWYRSTKRISLERENLTHRGPAYVQERCRRVWNFGCARLAIFLGRAPSHSSMEHIVEALGIEHDKAFEKYRPQPYSGNVVLFRASSQLRGIMADSQLGWSDILRGTLNMYEVQGHQQSILIEPNVGHLAEKLAACLRAAQPQEELAEV